MPDSLPDLTFESLADRLGHTLTVAGRTVAGAFIVPLELVTVSAPSTYRRLTAFTADLVGPVGTRLTEPGRYLTRSDGQRFGVTLSWVSPRPDMVRYRATFVRCARGQDFSTPHRDPRSRVVRAL